LRRIFFEIEIMEEGLRTAFMLLTVGMITVFTILALIVIFGNVLVSLVNKFIPEARVSAIVQRRSHDVIKPSKMAAIVSAVDIVTEGKAKVTSIRKV
jgi:oxaloacetate decarboxylase gamma subunit